jgi:hypothetical protein
MKLVAQPVGDGIAQTGGQYRRPLASLLSLVESGTPDSSHTLTQLNACIPLEGAENLKHAMVRAAVLGREVCETVAQQHHRSWHQIAAEEILRTLTI